MSRTLREEVIKRQAERKQSPSVATIALIGAICFSSSIGLWYHAWSEFSNPSKILLPQKAWYDDCLFGIVHFSFALACAIYIRYRMQLRKIGVVATARDWKARREVRFAIYAYAIVMFMQFPTTILTAYLGTLGPALYRRNFFDTYRWSDAVPPVIMGAIIIAYDRYRISKSAKIAGLCTTCGYDLRATPLRCPECGQVVQKGTIKKTGT